VGGGGRDLPLMLGVLRNGRLAGGTNLVHPVSWDWGGKRKFVLLQMRLQGGRGQFFGRPWMK